MGDQAAKQSEQYFSSFPKRTYPKGQIIIFAEEEPESVYYIAKGKVRNYDLSYRGDEVIVNIFKPGAFFPMSWAINHTPNKYFYKTEEETTVHVVPADAAVTFLKNTPAVTFDLLARLYRGLDGILGRMVHLMSGTARSRVLYELIIECRRFGKPDGAKGYKLDISEVDLAARSGLSRETVSREIGKFKQQNLLSLHGGKILVTELQKLEALLGVEV
jgi:CRP-like cAMP-binding protein